MLWYRLSIQEPQSIGQGLLCMLEDKHDYSTGEQWLEMNFYPRDQMEGESPIGVNTLSLILEPVKSSDEVGTAVSGSDTASGVCWEVSSNWYEECSQTHETCNRHLASTAFHPSRLLDVGGGTSPNVKICIYPESRMNQPYLTLSHCWGKIAFLHLQKDNLDILTNDFPVSSLPQTFQDAVAFTRGMGIRFLWIDSLCIIQDSLKDWEQESTLMEKVYGNTSLNLAATAAINSSKGLFSKRNPASLSVCTVQSKWSDHDNGLFALIEEDFWDFHVNESPLLQRAWVQQEVSLAPRVLHFGQQQLFWDCREMKACETFKRGLHPAVRMNHTRLEEAVADLTLTMRAPREAGSEQVLSCLDWWARLVSRYTSCSLTKESDKLVALSGLAKEIGPMLQATYLAGLWSNDIVYQLLWRVEFPIAKDSVRRPRLYRAPSWSWAAIESPVVFDTAFSDENNWQLVRLSDWEIIPVTADVTGQIKSGLIHIRGTSFQARLVEDEYKRNDPFSTQFDLTHSPDFIIEGCRQEIQAVACLDMPLGSQQEQVFAVPLTCTSQPEQRLEVRGLLLKKAKHHGPDSFSRLGTFQVVDELLFLGATRGSSALDNQHKDELATDARILVNELVRRCYDSTITTDLKATMDADSQHQWLEKAKGISERTVEKITLI